MFDEFHTSFQNFVLTEWDRSFLGCFMLSFGEWNRDVYFKSVIV
jgi:hypothetical protein